MKKNLSWFLVILFLFTLNSCKPATPVQDWVPLQTELLHNGSVAMYSIKNKLGDVEVYYTNHILREADNCVIVQEYTGKTEEYTKRLRLDGASLNLISYDVIQNNKEADLTSTTVNSLQFTMLSGKKTHQTYLISDFLDEKPKHTRLFIGEFFIENDFFLTLLTAFPFETTKQATYKVVRTMSVMDPEEKTNWETKAFYIAGEEEILYKRKPVPTYRVSFPAEKATAWFSQEAPHMLIRAEFPTNTIELIDWNEL
ncbi:hypothetical protein LLG10_01560 [bacterium]|nr:hypothetical protein [bacterium]